MRKRRADTVMEPLGLTVTFALLFGISSVTCQVNVISTYGGADVLGVVGSAINFSWAFTGDVDFLQWGTKKLTSDSVKDVLVSLTASGSSPITPPVQYSGRVSGSWDGKTAPGHVVFTLTSIKKEDDKFYACQFEPKGILGTTVYDTLHLVVRERPSITPPTIASSYTEGAPVSINCTAAGTPEPDVQWYKKDQLKGAGHKTASLTFSSIKRDDSGNYTCRANNSVGSTDVTVKITVHYPATIKGHSSVSLKSWIGQTVTLQCTSDGLPVPTITWKKPNGATLKEVMAYDNTVTVIMTNDQDFGNYSCTANNGLTPSDSLTAKIQQIKEPGAPVITSTDADIQATSLTVKWREPTDNGGSPITGYRVVILRTGTEIKRANVTDPTKRHLSIGDLEKHTNYTLKLFARNVVFEGPAAARTLKTKFEGGNPGTGGLERDGIDTAIIAGAAAACVLLIIGVIILIVLWRRRKSSGQDETSRDELGGDNMGEPDEGYASVSRAAAQSLGADGPTAAVNYAVVDPSKKKKNRQPAVSIEYAQVDPSKKAKKNKKKKPGDLDYAELGEFRPEYPPAASAQPAAGATAPAATRRAPAYEHTEYADITQFGIPQSEPTYANLSKKDDVVYSNVESM